MGTQAVEAPMQGTIVSVDVRGGDAVQAGQQLLVIESMKMEHVIAADVGGLVAEVAVAAGETVLPGDVLVRIEPSAVAATAAEAAPLVEAGGERADLAEVVERHAVTGDERRPDAVARRRESRQRTARENVEDLGQISPLFSRSGDV